MSNKTSKDTNITADLLKAELQATAKDLQNSAFVCHPHQKLMSSLLEQIPKIDFWALAGLDSDNEGAKLKKPHYLIITVEQVLELAKNNRWDLCQREGFFYSYNGAYWKPLEKDDLRNFLKKAAERMGIDKFMARYKDFAKDLFEQFQESAYLPAPVSDRETVKINLTNGTFEINAGYPNLRAPDASDFLTHQLPFAYDPTATAPMFQAFLDRVQPDTDCQRLLAEYMGYVFISPAKLKLEKTLLLYGSGANGKSVFFEIVIALLGPDNVSNYSLQSLTNEPAYCRAHLATKLVNYASEINGRLDANTFKQMVSGEPVEARLPYGQPFILTNYAKLIFNCNDLPADVEHTPAYFRRFLIVPFSVTIPENEQDKQLSAKIVGSELSGVFNWVLAGLHRLLRQGRFTECEAVWEQLEAYRKQSDSVQLFLDENEYSTDVDRYTLLKELYRDYRLYCQESGHSPVKKPNFQKRLNAIGIQTERRNAGNVAFIRKPNTLN